MKKNLHLKMTDGDEVLHSRGANTPKGDLWSKLFQNSDLALQLGVLDKSGGSFRAHLQGYGEVTVTAACAAPAGTNFMSNVFKVVCSGSTVKEQTAFVKVDTLSCISRSRFDC